MCPREFFLSDDPEEKAFRHQRLAVLTRKDVIAIERAMPDLGKTGLIDVLDRRAEGIGIDQAIFDWKQFRKNKGLPQSAKDFFSWVERNMKKPVAEKILPDIDFALSRGLNGEAAEDSGDPATGLSEPLDRKSNQ